MNEPLCPTCGRPLSWTAAPFGLRLRMLREQRGLNQRDAAKALLMPQATVSFYEQRIEFPGEKMLRRFAESYGVSILFLMGLENEP